MEAVEYAASPRYAAQGCMRFGPHVPGIYLLRHIEVLPQVPQVFK